MIFKLRKLLPISDSLLRYLIVGVAAFTAEYASFYVLYQELKWHLYIANSLSFGLGLLTSFLCNRLWTFGNVKKSYNKNPAHQLSMYVTLALINFALTNLIVEVLAHYAVNPRIGKLIAMVATSLWNYFLFKFIIFTHHKD